MSKARIFSGFAVLILLASLIFQGCSQRTPEGVLTQDQMVILFRDFYLREARLKEARVTEDSAMIIFTRLRKDVARNTNIPDSLFDRSLHYYLGQPEMLNGIYDRVIDSLSLQEQRSKSVPADHRRAQ